MSAPETNAVRETVEEAAGRWFARTRAGDMSEAESRALDVWLQTAEHSRALENMRIAWRDVETMRDDPRIMAMRAEAAHQRRAPLRLVIGAVAASVALTAIGAGAAVMLERGALKGAGFDNRSYSTALGQRSTVTLPDGTIVTLNTDTALRTEAAWGKRVVRVERGQAFFHVAKDRAHPFVVAVSGRTVTALGTSFDVRKDDAQRFRVTLVEGAVKVEAKVADGGREAVELTAGTQLIAFGEGRWSVRPVDVSQEVSWLSGQLVFSNTPLRDVAAEINRYSARKVIIEDPEFGRTLISGTFTANDAAEFARGLRSYKLASIEEETPMEIRLGPPKR